MKLKTISIGGWFQRTTLHLTEIYEFLKLGKSDLNLNSEKLKNYQLALDIHNVERKNLHLEYINFQTSNEIDGKIYEDGLVVLEKKFTELHSDITSLKTFYEDRLSVGLNYIFSQGAPVPKELANITNVYPFIITVENATQEDVDSLFKLANDTPYSTIEGKDETVTKGDIIHVINIIKHKIDPKFLVESFIFFREFKGQLHQYLNIHRTIWEEVSQIIELKTIKGTDIDTMRTKLEDYQKTVNLIDSRINQMKSYIKTRQQIAITTNTDKALNDFFNFKFEALIDTHIYVVDLWKMTDNYIKQAIEIFNDVQNRRTQKKLEVLTVITTIGAISNVFRFLSGDFKTRIDGLPGIISTAIVVVTSIILYITIKKFSSSSNYQIHK